MRRIGAWLVFVTGVVALVFAWVGLSNSQLDSREMLLVALFGGATVFIAVSVRGLFPRRG